MRIEKSDLTITTEKALEGYDARAVRGFFGRLFKAVPAFHGHNGEAFSYKHPLIQYKVLDGEALITGLKEGAYLLKAVPPLKQLIVHGESLHVVTQSRNDDVVDFGLCDRPIEYQFITPWIALNQDNYRTYCACTDDPEGVGRLLTRVLIGNLLSISKAVKYVVDNTIALELNPEACNVLEAKRRVHLMGFSCRFQTNFIIPENWGVGKFSSHGYGVVARVKNT
jgi:hypothetical protein